MIFVYYCWRLQGYGGVAGEYFDGSSYIGQVVSTYMCIYWYVDIHTLIQ